MSDLNRSIKIRHEAIKSHTPEELAAFGAHVLVELANQHIGDEGSRGQGVRRQAASDLLRHYGALPQAQDKELEEIRMEIDAVVPVVDIPSGTIGAEEQEHTND